MRAWWLKGGVALVLSLGVASAWAQPGGPTRPQVPMPEGEVRNVLLKNCVSCHGIDDYAFHALTRERWETMLNELHAGYPMKPLAEKDKRLVLDYLAETFGTEHTPFPRKYVPPEINTYFNDPQGIAMLDSVCAECHALDRVYETRGTLERWRVLLLEMRARGADLSDDEEMERMAEWLSRVQSANTFE